MKKFNIDDYFKGWFIGDFDPTLFQTKNFEVAVKYYQKGDGESGHYHKVATEYTVIVTGSVRMNGEVYKAGDIIEIKPGEITDFEALEKSSTVVVKIPCVKGDKYLP